jgi:thiamine-monophosphate kinase
VGIEIDADRLPVAAGVAEVAAAAGIDPLDLVAGGGEDYELLAALPAGRLDGALAACEAVGVRLSAIGKVSAEPGVRITGPRGGVRVPRGFDHLR